MTINKYTQQQLNDVVDAIELQMTQAERRFPTGFAKLDTVTGGLAAGELTLLCGYPQSGLSAFLSSILVNHLNNQMCHSAPTNKIGNCADAHHQFTSAASGVPLLVSTEMDATSIWQRVLSAAINMPLSTFQCAQFSDEQWADLSNCLAFLQQHSVLQLAVCNPLSRSKLTEQLEQLIVQRSNTDTSISCVLVDCINLATGGNKIELMNVLSDLRGWAQQHNLAVLVSCRVMPDSVKSETVLFDHNSLIQQGLNTHLVDSVWTPVIAEPDPSSFAAESRALFPVDDCMQILKSPRCRSQTVPLIWHADTLRFGCHTDFDGTDSPST